MATWRRVVCVAFAGWLGCAGNQQPADWVSQPPTGCAVGSSGPTRNPGHAIRAARRNSLRNLATGTLGVQIESELRSVGDRVGELTRQRTLGVQRDARIHSLWTDLDRSRDRVEVKEVHALACLRGVRPEPRPPQRYPMWVLESPVSPSRLCVLGVGGPTRRAKDQDRAALEDGRRALAEALESRVSARLTDTGRGLAQVSSEVEPSARSIAQANRVEALTEGWRDEETEGPLGLRGVLYGLVCLEGRRF